MKKECCKTALEPFEINLLSQQEKPCILVVDDQPINLKLLQRKLEHHQLRVLLAESGKECLQLVAQHLPDLILLDIMMPEMDGIETCRRLKANTKTASIPVLFVSARTSRENKLEGLQAGAVDYITKPIDLEETMARVRTHLRLQEMFRDNLNLQERLGDARKTAAVGAITQGIAHNLNNLLGVVVGYLDLIKSSGNCPENVLRNLGLMDNAVNKMVHIIEQLSTIAKNEHHERSNLRIQTLLNNSLRRFHKEYSIQTEIELKNALPSSENILANSEIFEILLGQLLINAWESYPDEMPNDQRLIKIQVAAIESRGTPMLEVRVTDSGQGIDPSVADSLFEPFITTKRKMNHGMGLTIARHTLRNINGDIQLSSNPGGGVTAIMTHPLT